MEPEIRGVMYVQKEDIKELYKDDRFYIMPYGTPPQHKNSIGIYVTHYCRLEVVVIKDKCDTCVNYKSREE